MARTLTRRRFLATTAAAAIPTRPGRPVPILRILATLAVWWPLVLPADPAADPATRSRVVIVRPVILCNDDGSAPARHTLPKNLPDQVFTRADLEFLYLDPLHWHHGRARRGEINLDTIVTEGRANGMIASDPRMITLLFVSAVDGHPGPLGRGMQGGNICFVSLGPPEKMQDPAARAFVVAHEIGHCLGMIHAVDDPQVPDDVPNLQGDGPFEERLAVEALHPSQLPTIHSSPSVLPRILFHSREDSARLLRHDSWHNQPGALGPDELRFQLGLPPDHPLPDDTEERAAFARDRFASFATSFDDRETRIIRRHVARLEQLIGHRWPLLSRLPWHFIKVRSGFCRGMAHTRGLTTILTAEHVDRFARDEALALEVLLHEKLHVLQRISPGRFSPTFQRYGFKPAPLAPGEPARLSIIRNPDAPPPFWALHQDGRALLIATTLVPADTGYKFVSRYHPLTPGPDGHTAGPAIPEPPAVTAWRSKLPIRSGFDDPREINAYLLGRILQIDLLDKAPDELTPDQLEILAEERRHLPALLELHPTDTVANPPLP